MTAKEVFELRRQGRKEEAYEAARSLYATDKGPYPSVAMFWTAVDMLRLRVSENLLDEAHKIFLALERLLPTVPDKDGQASDALARCRDLLESEQSPSQLIDIGPKHLLTGAWGEEVAANFLREKGYVILERDWHSKHRDIDIIAQDGDTTVFVEVKTRSNCDFGNPVVAVDHQKRNNLRNAIQHYLNYRNITNYRFDVISIVGTINCSNPDIEHIEDFNIQELSSHRTGRRR
jgi:uncharacterized protein (TIGR00252 family)